MKRAVTTACVAGVQIVLLVLATFAFDLHQPAHAEQVEAPDRKVGTVRVTYVETFRLGDLAYVELNDGSTWHLRPCRVEDGRHCYWNARSRGNTIGRSFVVIRGDRLFTGRLR